MIDSVALRQSQPDNEATMLVKELRSSIEDIKAILKSAGNAKAEAALDEVTAALGTIGERTVDDFVRQLERDARPANTNNAASYADRMSAAGFNEEQFLSVWRELVDDRSLKKVDLQKLSAAYLGHFDRRSSADELKGDIKRGFYTRVYDRDAQAMANRATPW